MLTFFIPGLFALWFFCAFHLTTATPISTDHLQRRQSNLPAYVVEYGKGTTADGGGHNFQMVLLMNMAWEYAQSICVCRLAQESLNPSGLSNTP
jgi:hypothetical protein